jgi:hypothetical protein
MIHEPAGRPADETRRRDSSAVSVGAYIVEEPGAYLAQAAITSQVAILVRATCKCR